MPGVLAFSRGSQFVALSHSRSSLHLLEVSSWSQLGVFQSRSANPIDSICFSNDLLSLAVSRGSLIELWKPGKVRAQLTRMYLDWEYMPLPEP